MAGHKRFTVATDIQVYFCVIDELLPWRVADKLHTRASPPNSAA